MQITGFDDLADELDEIANAFDRMQSRAGTEADAHGAIEEGVSRAMERVIVPEAKREGRRHVPAKDAETIDHERGEWSADRYRHYFYATSDLVKYHEFGTGRDAGNGGYVIRPNGDYPLGIPASRWTGPNHMVNGDTGKVHLEYVVHPGVRGKHFMQRALQDNANRTRGYILSQINEMFRQNGIK